MECFNYSNLDEELHVATALGEMYCMLSMAGLLLLNVWEDLHSEELTSHCNQMDP